MRETTGLYSQLLPEAELIPMNAFMERVSFGDSSIDFMAAGPSFRPNAALSMYLVCSTENQVRKAWELLSPSGKVLMPLQAYNWGPLYGWVEDRFGVSWQISHGDAIENPQLVTPALMFTGRQFGRAREALTLYTSIFPNSEVHVVSTYGEEDEVQAGSVSHAQASLNGNRIIVFDSGIDHDNVAFTEGTSLMVTCTTQSEIDHYWDALTADGGSAGNCGWLKDRFGVSWQIIPAQLGEWMSDAERANIVGRLLRTMGKLDLAALRDA